MAEKKKAVLMMHTDLEQGQLWHAALEAQNLDVISQNVTFDLVQYLGTCDLQKLPDLLLIDMAIKSPSAETLQSSSVCQWVNKHQVSIKVILFNPRQDRIKDIERSWALRRGASDILPRLSSENLMAEIARVTALIGCSLISQPLEKIAKNIDSSVISSQDREVWLAEIANVEPIKKNSKSESKNDAGSTVMYRGVRVRR